MKKQITMKQLLDMIEKGKQPNKVSIYGVRCKWNPCKKCYMEESTFGNSIFINIGADIFNKERIVEYDEEILDGVEKRYLRGIIEPFRNRVTSIQKACYGHDSYRIYIYYKEKEDMPLLRYFMVLPSFKRSTKMYEKMETGEEYTLEELGL